MQKFAGVMLFLIIQESPALNPWGHLPWIDFIDILTFGILNDFFMLFSPKNQPMKTLYFYPYKTGSI
jgi:hypothetical protein